MTKPICIIVTIPEAGDFFDWDILRQESFDEGTDTGAMRAWAIVQLSHHLGCAHFTSDPDLGDYLVVYVQPDGPTAPLHAAIAKFSDGKARQQWRKFLLAGLAAASQTLGCAEFLTAVN